MNQTEPMPTEENPSPLFAPRKRHTNTLREALDGASNHLLSNALLNQCADVFAGGFGPEPTITYKVSIRRDAANPEKYTYRASTTVSHSVGASPTLHGLAD